MAYDNFIDNNGVLLPAHDALWADAAEYGGLAGNFVIESDQLLAPAGFAAARYTGSSRDESRVTLPFPPPATYYGPAIRMGSSSIGYFAYVSGLPSGLLNVYLLTPAGVYVFEHLILPSGTTEVVLDISMTGSTVIVKANGTQVISYVDPSSPLPSAGNPGIAAIPENGSIGGIMEWNDGVTNGYFPWFRRRIMTAGMATLGG